MSHGNIDEWKEANKAISACLKLEHRLEDLQRYGKDWEAEIAVIRQVRKAIAAHAASLMKEGGE